MKYAVTFTAAALLLGASTMSAQACNPLLGKNFGKHVVPMSMPASMLAKRSPNIPARPSIVGLWHDVHTASDGSLFLEGYDTWHNDGTEDELGNLPPATGPICVGAWTQNGNSVTLLTHVTWLYDTSNNWVGTLNMTQTNKVARDGNSYKGTFDAKFYDTSGNQFMEITGTTKAERLNGA
jgi:hypothetical protein